MNIFHNHMSKDTRAEQLMWEQFPLHRCCRDGDVASLYSLVTAGSHGIFAEDSFYGWTPIHWAARFDRPQCLDILVRQTSLAKSSDVEVSGTRQTPLHVAAAAGAVNSLRWLLQHRADPNQKDYVGETALHKASRCGVVESVVMLAEAGAQGLVKNQRNESPVDLARSAQIKSVLSQLHLSQRDSTFPDTDMEEACDYHDSVNTSRPTNVPKLLSANLPNNYKRSRPSEDCIGLKRVRLSNCGDDFVPDLSFLFGNGSSTNVNTASNGQTVPHPLPSNGFCDDDASRNGPNGNTVNGHRGNGDGFLSSALHGNSILHGDNEDGNGMKTISSRINGNHASFPPSSADEDEMDEDNAESNEVSDTATHGSQLPPHLIPPLTAEEALGNGIGIPMAVGARLDNGKADRSKCVWFRSSCYI